ncbi:hypothetical protein ACA910_011032 [Epithemia clementina (nom. ined.)]
MTAPVRRSSSLSSRSSSIRKDELVLELVSKNSEQETLESTACSTTMDESVSRTHPATHEVNVNLLGVAGITVDRRNCRGVSKSKVAPPPPEDMRAIITLRELNNPSSQLLVRSEWSSCLKPSVETEDASGGRQYGSRYLALWNSNNALPGSPFSFETQIEVDSSGRGERKSFELIVSLADATSTEKDLVLVPIGSSILALEGVGSSSIIDLSLDNVLPSDFHPVETLSNPNYIKKEVQPLKPSPERIKPKRKFNFFKRRQHRQQLKEDMDEEEEKKEDDSHGETLFQSTDLSTAYAIDQSGDAVLRLELDWKMRDPEIDRSIEKTLTRGRGLIQARKHSSKRLVAAEPGASEKDKVTTALHESDVEAPKAALEAVPEAIRETDTDADMDFDFVRERSFQTVNQEPSATCTSPYFDGTWEANWGFDWGSKKKDQRTAASLGFSSNEEIIQFGKAADPGPRPTDASSQVSKAMSDDTEDRKLENAFERLLGVEQQQPKAENQESADNIQSTSDDTTRPQSLAGPVSPSSTTIKDSDREGEPNSDGVGESVERVLSWDRSVQSNGSKSTKIISDAGNDTVPLTNSLIARAISWGERSTQSRGGKSTSSSIQNASRDATGRGMQRVVSWDEKSIKSQKSASSRKKEKRRSFNDSMNRVSSGDENTIEKTSMNEQDIAARAPSPIPEEQPVELDDNASTRSNTSRSPSLASNKTPPKTPSQAQGSPRSSTSASSSVHSRNSTAGSSVKSKRNAAYERRLSRSPSCLSEPASKGSLAEPGSISLSRSASLDTSAKEEKNEIPFYSMRVSTPSIHSAQSRSLRGEELVSENGTDGGSVVNTDVSSRAPASSVSRKSSFVDNISIEQSDSQLELVFSQSETSYVSASESGTKSETTESRPEIGNEAAIRAMSEAAKKALERQDEEEDNTSKKDALRRQLFSGRMDKKTAEEKRRSIGTTQSPVGRSKVGHLPPRTSLSATLASNTLESPAKRGSTMSVDGSLKRGGSTVKVSNRGPPASPTTNREKPIPVDTIEGPILSTGEYSNPRLTDDDAFSFSVTKDSRREYSIRGKRASNSLLPGCGILTDVVDTAFGRCGDDDDISWQNTMDDESIVTRSTFQTLQQRSSDGKPFRAAANLLRQCGPNQMADLGDAVVEESKEIKAMWDKYRRKMRGNDSFATTSHDEQPSYKTGTAYVSHVPTETDAEGSEGDGESFEENEKVQLDREQTDPTSNRRRKTLSKQLADSKLNNASAAVRSPNGRSPTSVINNIGGDSSGDKKPKPKSAMFSLSQGFVNLVTCTNRFDDPDSSSLISYQVPRELFSGDDRSVGALTVSTYERKLDLLQSMSTNKQEDGDDDEMGLEADDIPKM